MARLVQHSLRSSTSVVRPQLPSSFLFTRAERSLLDAILLCLLAIRPPIDVCLGRACMFGATAYQYKVPHAQIDGIRATGVQVEETK